MFYSMISFVLPFYWIWCVCVCMFFLRLLFFYSAFVFWLCSHNLKIDYPMTKYALTLKSECVCAERIPRSHSKIFDKPERKAKIVFFSIDLFVFIDRVRSRLCWSDLVFILKNELIIWGASYTLHVSSVAQSMFYVHFILSFFLLSVRLAS